MCGEGGVGRMSRISQGRRVDRRVEPWRQSCVGRLLDWARDHQLQQAVREREDRGCWRGTESQRSEAWGGQPVLRGATKEQLRTQKATWEAPSRTKLPVLKQPVENAQKMASTHPFSLCFWWS